MNSLIVVKAAVRRYPGPILTLWGACLVVGVLYGYLVLAPMVLR